MQSSVEVTTLEVNGDGASPGARRLARETPVAIVHDGATHAVMMATPSDLEDFAIGFSLTEGIISGTADVRDLEIVGHDDGYELRLWLAAAASADAARRRRLTVGPTGCGLCGVESLAEARKPARRVGPGGVLSIRDVHAARAAIETAQKIGLSTRATHAAGLWTREGGLLAVREDVGRHNALDKLAGHAVRAGIDTAAAVVVITSRVSVEMVQKSAMLGAPVLVAMSAPTDLAVETAAEAGLTLVAVARQDGFEVFAGAHRLLTD